MRLEIKGTVRHRCYSRCTMFIVGRVLDEVALSVGKLNLDLGNNTNKILG